MLDGRWSRLILLFCLFALIVPSHVIGIDKFVTYDEPWWVISGSNYYYALTHRDFENTIYDYHPAVTTTWMVTAGMLSYFPEYRGFGQGYFDVRKLQFEEFLREHGKEAAVLVRNSRLIQTAVLTALLLLAFFLLQLLVDPMAAFLAIALLSTAPFYLGISRLLNHEGLLSTFVLISLLGMQVYLNKERRLIYLFISGAAFGLAQLTKSSSIAVIPVMGIMLLHGLFRQDGRTIQTRVLDAAKTFLVWFVAAAFMYVILWPGMWVTPGKMLYEIYGNAFSYAFQGARLDVTQELQPSHFSIGNVFTESQNYINTWVLTSTPITWLGLGLAFLFLFSRDKATAAPPTKSTMIYFVMIAVLFVLLFSVAHGRNAPYYILSSFVALDVVAGIGWGCFLIWFQKLIPVFRRLSVRVFGVVAVVGFQIANVIPYYPYYITYQNPVLEKPIAYGYGVGLDQAALYLSQKPDADENIVYAYLGMGSFSYFYPGETKIFKKAYLLEGNLSGVASDMRASDYLVVYSAVQNREPESKKFMDALKNLEPEKIIYINGVEYDRIYKISDIPESVYEELSK